jgi:hypothetical protein
LVRVPLLLQELARPLEPRLAPAQPAELLRAPAQRVLLPLEAATQAEARRPPVATLVRNEVRRVR